MERIKPTLEERIDDLARNTAAPAAFVAKVRALFAQKGIGLETSAEPFEAALERAFRRQAEAARSVEDAQRSLGRLQARLAEINGAFREQVAELRGMRDLMERQARWLAVLAPRGVEISRYDRLVRGEWDLAVVPGPDEAQ